MKGDLSTLKKICRYASTVMLAGSLILAAAIAATVVLWIGTAAGYAPFSDALAAWIGVDSVSGQGIYALLEMLIVLSLGAATSFCLYKFMRSIYLEHSPFTKGNVDSMRMLSKTYLIVSILIAACDWMSRKNLTSAMILLFGSIMVGVVVYCLALAFRYGAVLQKESDETLRGGNGYNTEARQGDGGQEDVPEPARGEGRDIEREPLQHQNGKDLRHKVLHPERDMQSLGLPAGGHPRICGG
jgi:hypothetical protein